MPEFNPNEIRLQLLKQQEDLKQQIYSELQQQDSPHNCQLLHQLRHASEQNWPEIMRDQVSWQVAMLVKTMESIQASLSQLDLNLYGICCDCEQPIEPDRLRHTPTTQRCLACEKK